MSINPSQRAWLTGDLTNHQAESALLSDKHRLTSVDLTWKMLCVLMSFCGWNKMPPDVHSCLFHALSKYEKMIGLHAAWTEVLAQSKSPKFSYAFFHIRHPFLSKCMLRLRKRWKLNLVRICFWQTKVSEAVCKTWLTQREVVYIVYVKTFLMRIYDSMCKDLN